VSNRNRNGLRPAEQGQCRRCAIYTRKSTSAGLEQEFNTLDAQREVCERYIQSQMGAGWTVLPKHYDDGGFTGANLERPAFSELMADLEAGKVDIIVVYKVDRLSRSLLDFARVMDHLSTHGVDFVSVTQNFSTADAMGRLTLNMLMSFSEFEREMIAERTRDKIAAARRRGMWTGGSVPLGYDVVNKKLMVNDAEAALVRELFDLYLEYKSTMATVRELNRRGRTTKRHQAKSGNVRGGGQWHKNAVLSILRNPLYAGYMPHGQKLFDGVHSPIINRDLFHRTQVVLNNWRTRGPSGTRNPAYILRGVLRCSCGSALTSASTRTNGTEYRYYRCVTRDSRGSETCAARQVPAKAIEEFVVERIRDALAGNELTHAYAQSLTRIQEMKDYAAADRQALQQQLAQSEGATPDTEDSLRVRQHEMNLRIAELEQMSIDTEWVARVIQDFNQSWELLTPENRGRLIRAVVQRIVMNDNEGTVTVEMTDPATGLIPTGDSLCTEDEKAGVEQ